MEECVRQTAHLSESRSLPKPYCPLVCSQYEIELHCPVAGPLGFGQGMSQHRAGHAVPARIGMRCVSAIADMRSAALLIGLQVIGSDQTAFGFRHIGAFRQPKCQGIRLGDLRINRIRVSCAEDRAQDIPDPRMIVRGGASNRKVAQWIIAALHRILIGILPLELLLADISTSIFSFASTGVASIRPFFPALRLIPSSLPANLQLMTMQTPNSFPGAARLPEQVAFDRKELGIILGLYGRMVAAGEWRDYGISHLRDVAVFSVFRRAAEHPLYRIEKNPRLKHRQGLYSVIGMDGRILKRGHDLKTVLRVLERKLIRLVE